MCGDNVIGIGAPDEGFCIADVVFADEAIDGGLEVDDGVEDAVLEPSCHQLGEEAFDRVQP